MSAVAVVILLVALIVANLQAGSSPNTTTAGRQAPVQAGSGIEVAAVIVVLEGAQHLYQFQERWITYRSTAEALKHERYLYLAKAGPYLRADRHQQLAERIEGLISQEHAKWTSSQQQAPSNSERS